MSENSSEFLKRTCLICGCHTNQTINIYEPRSGPNIVQLIQAKFKFQPLNEDKYLCFSCNNWLINWHSLQALNSNDAESQSGTFRSHLNSGNVMQDEKSSGSKQQVEGCRPIALVKPRLSQEAATVGQSEAVVLESEHEDSRKPGPKINYNKRNFCLHLGSRGRLQQKSMQLCACGKCIVVRTSLKSLKAKSLSQPKCRKCRELSRLKANYTRSVMQVERELATREPPPQFARAVAFETQGPSLCQTPQQYEQHRLCLPKPTVDGKVVSMLRRLGTTLSRESQAKSHCNSVARLPQIMSPTKTTQKWLRPLEDDEVLVNFNTSVSEVLPSLAYHFAHVNSIAARRRLTFQISDTAEVIDLCEKEEEKEECQMQRLQQLNNNFTSAFHLPKGLTITLA